MPLCCVEVRNERVIHVCSLATHRDEPELILFGGGNQKGPRLMNAPKANSEIVDVSGASHVVTGGLGGLGLLTGRWLASEGAPAVVLVSRSGRMAQSGAFEWSLLKQTAAKVHIQRSDVANQVDTHRLILTAAGGGTPHTRGLWHAAGVLVDAVLARQHEDALRRVFAPKVDGARALQAVSSVVAVCSCVLFSSVAALLGGAGQVRALDARSNPHDLT